MAKRKEAVEAEAEQPVEVSADTVVRDLLQQCLDKGMISDKELRIKIRAALAL
jgi:hypothetical protein